MDVLNYLRSGQLSAANAAAVRHNERYSGIKLEARLAGIFEGVQRCEYEIMSEGSSISVSLLTDTYLSNVPMQLSAWNLDLATVRKSISMISKIKAPNPNKFVMSGALLSIDGDGKLSNNNICGFVEELNIPPETMVLDCPPMARVALYLRTLGRMEKETYSGSAFRHAKWLTILKACVSLNDWNTNPFVGRLAYLHDLGALNFEEKPDSTIRFLSPFALVCSMQARVVSILLSALFTWCNGRVNGLDTIYINEAEEYLKHRDLPVLHTRTITRTLKGLPSLKDAYVEVVDYILFDPFFRYTSYKKLIQTISCSLLGRAAYGTWIECIIPADISDVTANYSFHTMDVSSLPSDDIIVMSTALDQDLITIQETLPLVGRWYHHLCSKQAVLCGSLSYIAAVLQSPHLCVGFIHGNQGQAAVDHLKPQEIIGPRMGKYHLAFQDILKKKWLDAFLEIIDKEMLPKSFSEWKATHIPSLTTKSAGVQKRKVVGELKTKFGMKEVELQAASKSWVYFTQHAQLTERILIGDYMNTPLRVGFRSDIARKLRAILNMPLEQYLCEQSIAGAVKLWQARQDYFTLKSSSEKVTANHAYVFKYTDRTLRHLKVCRDFSAMDTHASSQVFRRASLSGIYAAMRLRANVLNTYEGFDVFLNEYKNVEDPPQSGFEAFVRRTYEKMLRSRFYTPMAPNNIFTLDAVLSGEALTINWHNMTNDSFSYLCLSALRDHPKLSHLNITLSYRSFTGDDSVEVFTINTLSSRWTADTVKIAKSVLDDIALDTGFPINFDKVRISFRGAEYLKKTIIGGRYIPLSGRIQIFMSERSQMSNDRFELLKSYCSTLSEVYSRGGCSEYLLRFAWTTAIYSADISVKKTAFNARTSGGVMKGIIPIACCLVPKDLHGLGWSPFTILHGSVGTILKQDFGLLLPEELKVLQRAAGICRSIHSSVGRIDVLATFPALQSGVKAAKDNLDGERLKNSRECADSVANKLGPTSAAWRKVSSLRYEDCPRSIVQQTTENVGEVKQFREIEYGAIISAINQEKQLEVAIDVRRNFNAHVKFTETTAEFPSSIIPTYELRFREIVATLGVPITDERPDSPLRLLSQIMDSKFPKHITLEKLASLVFDPAIRSSVDLIRDTIIMIGGDARKASAVATRIIASDMTKLQLNNLSQWSLTNPFLAFIDVRKNNLSRVVKTHNIPSDFETTYVEHWFSQWLYFNMSFSPLSVLIELSPAQKSIL